jgi:tetratricopeptide (TPR) repeat protein
MQRIERIIKYLDGKLDPLELEKFTSELKEDPSLLDELIIHKEVDTVMLQVDEERFRKKLKEVYAQFILEESKKSQIEISRKSKFKKILISGSLMTIILIIAGIFLFRRESNIELYTQYYKTFTQDMYIRSDNHTEVNKHLEAGITYYSQGEYALAFEQLDLYHQVDSAHIPAAFYCGLSALESGKITRAIPYFEWVINEKSNYYFEHAEWYLALTYIRLGEKSMALGLLNELKHRNSSYSQSSGKIISRLNRKRFKVFS